MNGTGKCNRMRAIAMKTNGLCGKRYRLAVKGSYFLLSYHLQHLLNSLLFRVYQGIGLVSGRKRAVVLVGPVCKYFAGSFQSGFLCRPYQPAVAKSEEA